MRTRIACAAVIAAGTALAAGLAAPAQAAPTTAPTAAPTAAPEVTVGQRAHESQRIPLAEYLAAPGADASAARTAAAVPCYRQYFESYLAVHGTIYLKYGFTGKWCYNSSTMYRLVILNPWEQSQGPGAVFDTLSHREIGRTINAAKTRSYAAMQWTAKGKVETMLGSVSFSDRPCLRAIATRSPFATQDSSCQV
ncbi:hypothetical protein ACFVH6_20800 [Spirillospora sp. NPDC127200]